MNVAARRIAAVIPLALIASGIASTCDGAGDSISGTLNIYPTNIDYLVLASIADSPQPFAITGYRSNIRTAPQVK
jgi:hypothetical protein